MAHKLYLSLAYTRSGIGLVLNQTIRSIVTAIFLVGLFSSCFYSSLLFSKSVWAADVGNIDKTTNGESLLNKHCTQCHGLPVAKSHKPGHWRNIILRMQNHRLKRGFKLLSESDIVLLAQYLDRASINQNAKMDNQSE